MNEDNSSYKQILKATSLFGGVQFINIIILIIRSKIVAELLGPLGMGIMGLLNSTINIISNITSFGLGISTVREIAEADKHKDNDYIAPIYAIIKKLVWITGVVGLAFTIIFSSWLSEVSFGNGNYSFAFIWLSITLLFTQLGNGQLSLLQGLRKLKLLAKANLFGTIFGLIFSVPIYYHFRLDGIVPAILITAFTTMGSAFYFSREIKIKTVSVGAKETWSKGRGMIKMGFFLGLSGLITSISSYLFRIYLSNAGGIDEVGLYNAGFAILETYVGMIFTAMSTEYFPRLSSVCGDNNKVREVVFQQSVISILIIVPIITIFVVFSPILIQILYSKEFLPIVKMVNLAILGMFFRAVSWSMGFILLAKNDSTLFIKTALGFNLLFFINNIVGYHLFGLTGLGGSFIFNYFLHYFFLFIICKNRYQFHFPLSFYPLFCISLFLCLLVFATSFISVLFLKFMIGIFIVLFSCFFSIKELNKRVALKSLIKK